MAGKVGRSGRPTTIPLNEKILNGTYRADRDGPKDAVLIATGKPEPPGHLKGEGLKFWQHILPLIERMGPGEIDSAALATMCEWYAKYRDACRLYPAAKKVGGLEYGRNLAAQKLCCDEWASFASKFGLTPSDRARLKISPQKKQDDFEAFLDKKQA